MTAHRAVATRSLVAQRFNRIETGREISGNERGKRADKKRADANDRNVSVG